MSDEIDNGGGIGERLRSAREFLELTQEEAAMAVGISRSALSLIEHGRRKVDSEELTRFARIYGQSVDALAGVSALPPLPESVKALPARRPNCPQTIATTYCDSSEGRS